MLATANKHFEIPHSVSALCTGREAQLEELKQIFLAPEPAIGTRVQKRFVIYGIGGEGKTEFCCKFTQDYRKQHVNAGGHQLPHTNHRRPQNSVIGESSTLTQARMVGQNTDTLSLPSNSLDERPTRKPQRIGFQIFSYLGS